MPITIGNNIASLMAQRRLAEGTSALERVFERLSSGQRINRASDDAAGLAIADSLRADSRVFTQGVRNLNDGISALSIADSALENLTGIVIRMRELSEQAANGTLGYQQRLSLDSEVQALVEEYNRISQTTSFNDLSLLNPAFGELSLQAGIGSAAVISSTFGGKVGDGTFQQNLVTGNRGSNIATGDLNGDGTIDIVTGNFNGGGLLTIGLGTGSGAFDVVQTVSGVASISGIDIGDFNQDGFRDIAFGRDNTGPSVNIMFGNGEGTFGEIVTIDTGSRVSEIRVSDIDGDGYDDIAASNPFSANISIFYGEGGGNFTRVNRGATFFQDIVFADINSDGRDDIITPIGNGTFRSYLANGDRTFADPAIQAVGGVSNEAIDAGDLNNDGLTDLVVANRTDNANYVLLGNGDGSFQTAVSFSTLAMSAGADVVLGDLNGDGFLDLGQTDGVGSVSVFIGNGDGTFQTRSDFSSGSTAMEILVADLNNDLIPDLINSNNSSDDYGIYFGNSRSGVAIIDGFDLTQRYKALDALSETEKLLNVISQQRSVIGAFQSRVDSAISTLQVASENFKAAESRIRDADIASESSRLVRLGILQQAASSVLAQANLQPQLALRLLNG